jgi:hypothetical protein
MGESDQNRYRPTKVPLKRPEPPPAPMSKKSALLLVASGAVLMMFGAHFDDPEGPGARLSHALQLVATAAHLVGGITLLIGLYRLYWANRSS